jgi:anti-sigma factor RsiW
MMGFGHNRRNRSCPELLAAYVDGELDPVARARVEAWLAEYPEARAELETQHRLSRRNQKLWNATAGPSPSEASWARLFHKVHGALNTRAEPAATRPRRRWVPVAAFAAAAAAVIFGVLLLRPPVGGGRVSPADDEPAWAVASDADIEIVSIQDADADRLVVGELPLRGPVQLAAASDVELVKVEKDTDGMMPLVQMNAGPNAPMIVAPLAGR